MGDVTSYLKDSNTLKNKPSTAIFGLGASNYKVQTSNNVFNTLLWTSAQYNKSCANKECGWKYDTVKRNPETLQDKCKGNKYYANTKCYSINKDNNQKVETADSACSGLKPTGLIQGDKACNIKIGPTYNKSNNTKVTTWSTETACNDTIPHFETTKECYDFSGNRISTTFGYNERNCLVRDSSGNYVMQAINSIQHIGTENKCSCVCNYPGTNTVVGQPAEGLACDLNGKNKCRSCISNMIIKNGQCVCDDTSGFYWDNKTQRCVKDEVCSKWSKYSSCSRNTCKQSRTRHVVSHAVGNGKSCGVKKQERNCSIAKKCTWNDYIPGKSLNSRGQEQNDRCKQYRKLSSGIDGCINGKKDKCPNNEVADLDVDCVGGWVDRSKVNDSHCSWYKVWKRDYNWKEYRISVNKCNNGKACPHSNGKTCCGSLAGHYYASGSC